MKSVTRNRKCRALFNRCQNELEVVLPPAASEMRVPGQDYGDTFRSYDLPLPSIIFGTICERAAEHIMKISH